MSETRTRKLHLDLIRVIAILCIVYNHTNKRGYFLYALTDNMLLKVISIAAAAFVAIGVPLFFMVSGALLLGKEESLQTLYRKRVLRIGLVLVIFSILQWLLRVADGRDEFTFRFFAEHLITDGAIPTYWFLYAYLAYLMILPFLRKLVQVMDQQTYVYLFAMLIVVEGVVPTLLYPFGIYELNSYFVIPMINRVVIYPLLGYYMEYILPADRYEERKNTGRAWAAIAVVLTFFVVMTLVRNLPYEEFTTYDKGLYTCSFTMILDMAVYYLAKKKYYMPAALDTASVDGGLPRVPRMQDSLLISLSSATFGIYLIEQPVREHTIVAYDALASVAGSGIAAVIWVLIVVAISYIMTLVLKKIPGIGKLL